MEVVATYRGETLSTSSAQVRAATVVGTLELESWRVNERRPATQAGRSSSRRVSSRPQVSKSLEQQLALRACVRGGAPDTNNLLNPPKSKLTCQVLSAGGDMHVGGGGGCLLGGGEGHMVRNLQQRKQPVTS